MTTAEQLRTQTMPCTNGCGRHVHYGVDPSSGRMAFALPLRAWEMAPLTEAERLRGQLVPGAWVEHVCLRTPPTDAHPDWCKCQRVCGGDQ